MKFRLTFWLLSVFGFPIGGFAAVNLASTNSGPIASIVAGFIAGFIIGVGQWLAARPHISLKWPFFTATGLAVGAALGSLAVNSKTDWISLTVFGFISGMFVAISQAFEFNLRFALQWFVVTLLLWTLAWAITALLLVDTERGYVVFGLSGAIVYTTLIGLLLRKILREVRI